MAMQGEQIVKLRVIQPFFRLFKVAKLACLANSFWSKFLLFLTQKSGKF
jgi:hypothetical protein